MKSKSLSVLSIPTVPNSPQQYKHKDAIITLI